jgi:hypothetical protein
MGRSDRKDEPAKKADDKKAEQEKTPLPPTDADDDDLYEDGDIATPKRDRYGNDDEPL